MLYIISVVHYKHYVYVSNKANHFIQHQQHINILVHIQQMMLAADPPFKKSINVIKNSNFTRHKYMRHLGPIVRSFWAWGNSYLTRISSVWYYDIIIVSLLPLTLNNLNIYNETSVTDGYQNHYNLRIILL